jgi:hypothetical protein
VTEPDREQIRLDIEAPQRLPRGEPVPITLIIGNTSDRHVDLYVTGRPVAFDIVITSADGTVVWRRLEGQTVAAILQVLELRPHSTFELRDDWMQRTNKGVAVEPGRYKIVGELIMERQGSLVSRPANLEIVAAPE